MFGDICCNSNLLGHQYSYLKGALLTHECKVFLNMTQWPPNWAISWVELLNLFLLISFGRVLLSHICYGYEYHEISFLPFKQGTIYVFLQNVVINITNETMLGLLIITNTLIQILFIWVLRQICILFWDNRIERYSKFTTQRNVNLLCVICFIRM